MRESKKLAMKKSLYWILDMYDAYLEQMGDEAANLPKAIPDKKKEDKK